jgi:hypothetical protein
MNRWGEIWSQVGAAGKTVLSWGRSCVLKAHAFFGTIGEAPELDRVAALPQRAEKWWAKR